MGRKLNQLCLLVKKNFQILTPRIISVFFELCLPVVILLACGLLRQLMKNETVCMGGYNPVEVNGTIWHNSTDNRLIAIGPNNEYVLDIVAIMMNQSQYTFDEEYTILNTAASEAVWNQQLKTFYNDSLRRIIVFPSQKFMEETLDLSSAYFRAAILFSNTTTSATNDNVNYTIRMHQTASKYESWKTDQAYLKYEVDLFTGRGDTSAYTSGWYQLQQLLEMSVVIAKGATYIPSIAIRPAPHPSYEKDYFATFIQSPITILAILISAMFMSSSVAADIIEEKCSKMREMMRMMGLTDSIMWIAWFIQRFCLVLIPSATITFALKVVNYMPETDGTLVFILLLEFYVLMIFWCFFLTTLIHKPSVAGFAMVVATYLTYLPYDVSAEEIEGFDRRTRMLFCLFPLSAIAQGTLVIGDWESIGQGLTWNNIGVGVSAIDTFTLADVMGMMLLDMVVMALAGWYIENVFPGEYGVPEKWYFMFTKTYWTGAVDSGVPTLSKENGTIEKLPFDDPTCHEDLPPNMTPGVIIRNLDKSFKTLVGPVLAVNKLSLEMYEGQITALLGHNGAGKTTTINMLTGMYPPTAGDAVIAGYSILTSMKQVRDDMGICPQHNILFKMMTVQQHLDFFIRLKGATGPAVQKEIESMLDKLGLKEKRKTVSNNLSGGQKRKLSVGIALCGGSKFILLDEPTSGMDPYNRRSTWDILLSFKENRTILFTTHSMDEADLLGDRIAIMSNGKLVCSGSSLFLKRRYGVGYNLTLVKDKNLIDEDVKKITKFVRSYVPSAELSSNVGAELSYLLSGADNKNFVPLFRTLETENEKYGINAFGVSLTTMEEVFMKAGEDGKSVADKPNVGEVKQIRKFKQEDLNTGFTLYCQQLMCQIKKRFINTKRNKSIAIAQLALPIIFAIIGLAGYSSSSDSLVGAARVISLANYPSGEVNASMYYADLRQGASSAITDTTLSYLKTLNVNINDTSSVAKALIDSYSGDTDSCCTNPYLQLNSTCIDSLNPTQWIECKAAKYANSDWTYKGCYDECIVLNDTGCTIQPYGKGPPDSKYVTDELSYFTNVFLEAADVYKGYFHKDKQGAITLSDLGNVSFVSRVTANLTSTPVYNETTTDYMVPQFTDTTDFMTGWASYKGIHIVPSLQNAMANIILRINDINAKIQVTNHPLPKTLEDSYTSSNDHSIIVLIFCFVFGISFLLASFAVFLVDERAGKSKHLQQISGVNPIVYWLGTFIWDYCNYFISVFCVFIVFCCFNMDAFQGARLGGLFLILVFLGYGCIPLVYVLSHIFAKGTTAFGVITAFLFIIASTGYLVYSVVLSLYETENITNKSDNKYAWILDMDRVCLIHPIYAAAVGIANLVDGHNKEITYKKCLSSGIGEPICKSLFPTKGVFDASSSGTGIGRNLIALFLVGTILLVIQLVVEVYWAKIRFYIGGIFTRVILNIRGIPYKNAPGDGEDERVRDERARVQSELQNLVANEAIVMNNLHKQFGKKAAVQNISLSINKGECFGLLGVNGAGKTTTFAMLTGDIAPTSGETYLYGYDVVNDLRQVQKYIGYCPQHDALIGIMTGREMLTMFANLRGIQKDIIPETVQEVIEMFDLEEYADKLSQTYSGGNKRKLSTGLAIIGTPPVIFLDEPTSGVDPTASRFLWNVLCYLRKMGCSIVLTSHSMEECEALCTQLVIMVNGSLQCLGSIQELKNTYSQGYTLTVIMDVEDQHSCQEFVERRFPEGVLKEQHTGYLLYSLGVTHKWSEIFEAMEQNKEDLGVKDYSVSQTSLEQVFLNFARLQEPEKEKLNFGQKIERCKNKLCCTCCKKKVVEDENINLAASESV